MLEGIFIIPTYILEKYVYTIKKNNKLVKLLVKYLTLVEVEF